MYPWRAIICNRFFADRRDVQLLYVAIAIATLGRESYSLTSLLIAPHCSPLVQVGQQAEAFRGLADIEPLPETGPRELVLLASQFQHYGRRDRTVVGQ